MTVPESEHSLTAVYSAFGERFVQLAAISSYSLKRHNPWIRTRIHTNKKIKSPVFDEIILEKPDDRFSQSKNAKLTKMRAIAESSSPLTLYLDCDTYIAGSLTDLTRLRHADIHAAFDTWQFPEIYRLYNNGHPRIDPNPGEPYFNAGVLLVRSTDQSRKLLNRWSQRFRDDSDMTLDQLVFREEAYAGYASIAVLPTIYNCRVGDPISVSGHIRISHASAAHNPADWRRSLPFITDFINSTHLNRVYVPFDGKMTCMNTDFSPHELSLSDHVAISETQEYLSPEISFE